MIGAIAEHLGNGCRYDHDAFYRSSVHWKLGITNQILGNLVIDPYQLMHFELDRMYSNPRCASKRLSRHHLTE